MVVFVEIVDFALGQLHQIIELVANGRDNG